MLWLSRSLHQTPIPARPGGVGDWFHDFPAAVNQSWMNLGTDLLSFVNSHLQAAFRPLLHPFVTGVGEELGHEPAEVTLLRQLPSSGPTRHSVSRNAVDKLTNIGRGILDIYSCIP